MSLDPTEGQGIPDELIAMYTAAELALLGAMAEAIIAGIDTEDWLSRQPAEMLRFRQQAQLVAARLQKAMPNMVEQAVAVAAELGRDAADADLDQVPDSEPAPPDDSQTRNRVERDTADAVHTLAQMTQSIPGAAADLYNEVTIRIEARHNPTMGTRLDAAQQALDILTKRGVTGFKDDGGRHWSLTSYIEMKSRTLVNNTMIDAHTDRMIERGHNLIVVSSHRNPAPQCQPFEGQVLSLDGETGTALYPSAVSDRAVKVRIKATLREARSRGFQHPNCRHAVSAYIPGASRTFTTRPNADGYEATQRQRALERAIRDAKRRQATAVTDQVKREQAQRIRDYQKRLREHISSHDLKRRPRRERINTAR